MSLKINNAGAAEILRASQKDNSYIENYQQHIFDILRRFFGSRFVTMHSPYIKIVTELTYYTFLTLSNAQTLGEEYTGIIQVDPSIITIPHKKIQLINIIFQCGGELFMKRFTSLLQKKVDDSSDMQPYAKDILLKMLHFFSGIQPFLQQMHRGLFFIIGGYFHISKRITAINYVLVRHWMKDHSFSRGFKFLGLITLLHSILNCGIVLAKSSKMQLPKRNISQNEMEMTRKSICKCVLCLYAMSHGSALPCGHIFCWYCISECLSSKPECPICREAAGNSQIVLLQNFV